MARDLKSFYVRSVTSIDANSLDSDMVIEFFLHHVDSMMNSPYPNYDGSLHCLLAAWHTAHTWSSTKLDDFSNEAIKTEIQIKFKDIKKARTQAIQSRKYTSDKIFQTLNLQTL